MSDERAGGRADDPTYYDVPVLKEPVWIWAVPAYFWAGGTAGAAGVLGAVAQAFGGEQARPLVRRCRDVSAAGTSVGTALLVYDLGRPTRFLNMLRVFRPSSPMSVGSWVLAAAAGASAVASVGGRSGGLVGWLGDLAGYAMGALGAPLAGYSAVLVANTAVPVWQESRRTLPVLFMAGGTAAAGSVLKLMGSGEEAVERFGKAGKVAELVAAFAVERELRGVERVGRPYREGVSGALWKAAKACTAASLALSLVGGRSRRNDVAGALLGIAGGLSMRFAVFYAGQHSARDPRATFHLQRR